MPRIDVANAARPDHRPRKTAAPLGESRVPDDAGTALPHCPCPSGRSPPEPLGNDRFFPPFPIRPKVRR
ncbi:MAG: hypothetical protein D6725_16575 [Planctomycetota bacterium]|nr:MAG: hypothetical protein D6725_16575 [Planctomycetota bacterium]